jgi:hypothetical protein
MNGNQWTNVQLDMLRAFYPDNTMETIKALTGRNESSIYNKVHSLGLEKSEAYLASPAACRLRRGDEIGKEYRFKTGQEVWNKGLKGWSAAGTEATRFKKGTKPPNHRPVGYIRLTKDGYYEIKVAEGMQKFKLLHRVIWERCNGEIPAGQICIFLDGNTRNLEVTNLALMTKVQNMKRNSLHSYPKELAEIIQLRGALNRQLNKRKNHEQPTA